MNLKHLSNKQLVLDTKTNVKKEREVTTVVLHHIKEVQRRRLFADDRCGSITEWVEKVLGYPNDQAWRRVSAASALAELPELEEKLETGALTLTHLCMARKHFRQEAKTERNYSKSQKLAVFEELSNTSTRQAEKLLLSQSSIKPELQEKVKQVTEDLTEIKFYASDELLQRIEKLKGLLAHSHPNITIAELMAKLCELGENAWDPAKQEVKTVAPRSAKFENGRTAKPRHEAAVDTTEAKPERVSAATKRLVFKRAESKCENCGSNRLLQIDHKIPRAKSGSSDPENLRLLCRSCNQRAAIKHFGLAKMQVFLSST